MSQVDILKILIMCACVFCIFCILYRKYKIDLKNEENKISSKDLFILDKSKYQRYQKNNFDYCELEKIKRAKEHINIINYKFNLEDIVCESEENKGND